AQASSTTRGGGAARDATRRRAPVPRATGSNDGGEEIEDGGGAPGLQVAEGAGGAVPLGEGVVAELAAAIFLHGVRGQFPSQEKSTHAARCRRPRWPASGSAGKERDSLGSGLSKQIEGAVARAGRRRPAPPRAA
ncbi:unnamed protein product, partial [Urochloa humidicola]